MKRFLQAVWAAAIIALFGVCVSSIARAHSGSPAMVVWTTGQTLTATDLNNALAHLHNTFSAAIVDSHISTSAGIQHSKLATPSLVSKAWVEIAGGCTNASSCTMSANSRIQGVWKIATGEYQVGLSNALSIPDTSYVVFATAINNTGGAGYFCNAGNLNSGTTPVTPWTVTSAGTWTVWCYTATATLADPPQGLSVTLFDDENY